MSVRNKLGTISAIVITMSFSSISQAELFDRGGGLIYDDVLDVTWLQDANYAQSSSFDADGQMKFVTAISEGNGSNLVPLLSKTTTRM